MAVHAAPFDSRRLRARRARAAPLYEERALLARILAHDLAERLAGINREFPRLAAFGGGATFARAVADIADLAARVGLLIRADPAPALVAAPGVAFEPEALPFAPESLDAFVAIFALHWVNDLPGVLAQVRRSLKPDGVFLAALPAGETLKELRAALIEAELETIGGAATRVIPFADLRDLGGLLQRAGFALPVADLDRRLVRYREPLDLLADLRAMGETAAALADPGPPLARATLARAREILLARHADPDGRVRATFEIATLTAWAPHPDQPRPLKPGSATARLADAIGRAGDE